MAHARSYPRDFSPSLACANLLDDLRKVTPIVFKHIHSALFIAIALLAATTAVAQFPGIAAPKHFPWSDKTLSADERADMVIEEMTLDEKIQLLHGPGWQSLFAPQESGPLTSAIAILGFIPGIPRLGIPDLQMTDSNQGVSMAGSKGRYATALPSAEAMAAAWDPELSYQTGTMIGDEIRAHGIQHVARIRYQPDPRTP